MERSPFILLVWIVKTCSSVLLFIPAFISNALVRKELRKNSTKRKTIDLINFGVIPYHFRKLRQQHLAEELAKKGVRIFYIESRFIPLADGKAKYSLTKEVDNVYVVKLASSRDIAIYHQPPTVKEINEIIGSLKQFINDIGITNPLAKVDYPFWAYITNHLKVPVIYDCMDDYEGFNITGSHILDLEKDLFKKSDITLVCSELLLKKVKKNRPRKTILLKNACEYTHFKKAYVKKDTCSAGLCWIRKPVIGFFGAVGEWIDTKLLIKIATSFPSASVVLIGEVQNEEILRIGETYPNIYLLGEKPYAKLPEYLQTFDICVIPFLINKHTRLIDPVKMYEYFAAGKPVVTTAIQEIETYKKLFYYSSSHEEFILNVRFALKEKNIKLRKKRQDVAQKNTWEKRSVILYKELLKLA